MYYYYLLILERNYQRRSVSSVDGFRRMPKGPVRRRGDGRKLLRNGSRRHEFCREGDHPIDKSKLAH
jgi:hypothetical protein